VQRVTLAKLQGLQDDCSHMNRRESQA